MAQGAELDLADIRFYTEATPVQFVRDNEPFEDLNANILLVDNKAILARDTAIQVASDLTAHIGSSGVSEHAVGTTSTAGFISVADKAKLDSIDEGAQVNTLPPTDALELISRKETTLHLHPTVTPTAPGFMGTAEKTKLDGIEPLAQVNNISNADAATLTNASNADALHTHGFSAGSETFTEAVHFTTNHAGLPGVTGFPGFSTSENFFVSSELIGAGGSGGSATFPKTYSFTVQSVTAGFAEIKDRGGWGANEQFLITDIVISGGNTVTVSFEVTPGTAGGGGDMNFRVWQGAF
jgi:hypothetical protein